MASLNPSGDPQAVSASPTPHAEFGPDDTIDLRDVFLRLYRGLYQTVGLTFLGIVIGAVAFFWVGNSQRVATSTRIVFSFPGFERGEYPDHSTFQPDDVRAPAVIAEALKRQGLDTSSEFQAAIRGGITIEGIIPANLAKSRDRLRASGQTPPPYFPDEYAVTLSLPRNFSLNSQQREKLLREIVGVYRENFQRTYVKVPLAFGNAFASLSNSDFPEYEIVLQREIDNITSYLNTQIEQARSFRSPSTNLSFKDLLEQTHLFAQIRLNEVLGAIRENGLTRNRRAAMTKLDYRLRLLENRERLATDEEKVVKDLLAQSQARDQSYVLGVKSQAQQTDSPMLDRGLIDSLLANDAYNFLVRRALDAGMEVTRVRNEKTRLIQARDNLKAFVENDAKDQSAIVSQVETSLKQLESAYNELIQNVRRTHADFAQQQYGNAIRFSDDVDTSSLLRGLAIASAVGAFLGFALGAGLSLLGLYIGGRRAN